MFLAFLKIEIYISKEATFNFQLYLNVYQWKSSSDFKNILDNYFLFVLDLSLVVEFLVACRFYVWYANFCYL